MSSGLPPLTLSPFHPATSQYHGELCKYLAWGLPEHGDQNFVWQIACARLSAHTKFELECSGTSRGGGEEGGACASRHLFSNAHDNLGTYV